MDRIKVIYVQQNLNVKYKFDLGNISSSTTFWCFSVMRYNSIVNLISVGFGMLKTCSELK